jgi:hypothetical protein
MRPFSSTIARGGSQFRSMDAIRGDLVGAQFPGLHPGYGKWVGWMTFFSSTTAIGGWIKRHPPYEIAGLTLDANSNR